MIYRAGLANKTITYTLLSIVCKYLKLSFQSYDNNNRYFLNSEKPQKVFFFYRLIHIKRCEWLVIWFSSYLIKQEAYNKDEEAPFA